MKLTTITKTVRCPYCQTGYTFRSLEAKRRWEATGSTQPASPGL